MIFVKDIPSRKGIFSFALLFHPLSVVASKITFLLKGIFTIIIVFHKRK